MKKKSFEVPDRNLWDEVARSIRPFGKRALKMSAASVSEHLSILRRNRLVTSRRSGRTVLYERTQLATDLCGGATK